MPEDDILKGLMEDHNELTEPTNIEPVKDGADDKGNASGGDNGQDNPDDAPDGAGDDGADDKSKLAGDEDGKGEQEPEANTPEPVKPSALLGLFGLYPCE
jgi:hypothetical protein